MTKSERIGAFIVGGVLFGGLFYVIYTSVFGPKPDYSALSGENFISDEFQGDDGEDETLTPAEESTGEAPAETVAPEPRMPAGEATEKVVPAAPPKAAPARKK